LKTERKHITVYEHQSLRVKEEELTQDLYDQFVKFYGNGVPYFSLIRNGVQFNEYVGVIQIGNTLIEVLPKADKNANDANKKEWQAALLGMLRAVHGFEVKAPTESSLALKSNSVLDLYFEMFIQEVERLLHSGLAKKYRRTEGNLTALKGSLIFSKQISKNLVHQERFYTQYTTYDTEHLLHIILYKTILLLKRINTSPKLLNRINSLVLNFPASDNYRMPSQKITEATFERITLNRKTQDYKKALDIARLLLMNYHPDLNKGNKHVLALLFDMNLLWEQFVLVSLKKSKSFKVTGQNSKGFWKPTNGRARSIRPDIKIQNNQGTFILDTKWKNVNSKPSIEDIRQMYAYHHYFEAEKVALLYPGEENYISGNFVQVNHKNINKNQECGLMFVDADSDVKKWQGKIVQQVASWVGTVNESANEEKKETVFYSSVKNRE
jgi:5-methylcytosine-specific restriction enzyme subunit McrC